MIDNSEYNILIVDDDSDIREMIAMKMRKTGYRCNTAADGNEALLLCEQKEFDVILLDIMMPNTDGYEFCEALRKNNQRCFIIFITALDGPDVLEKALLLGGDDFIRKPFELRELLARITSCLRRIDKNYLQKPEQPQPILLSDDTQLLPSKNRIISKGKEIRFTPIETELLYLFLSHPDKRFSYAELYETVWGESYLNDKGTVATFISSIKKKLNDGNVSINIETIWGEGYCYHVDIGSTEY